MNKARFLCDKDKCIGCGLCVKVCPGAVLFLDEDRRSAMKEFREFGWNGCWKCEHCLAVCPTGAISIFGKSPEDSVSPLPVGESQKALEALVVNRHSCRRYKNENVDRDTVDEMIRLLGNAPNGGNKQSVEFTLIDDKDRMEAFRRLAYGRMEELAEKGIFPEGFDEPSYRDLKEWEKTVRPDMLFSGAPHLLIPHAPKGVGESDMDVVVAATYFELLCASRGLGCILMTFPRDVLDLMPDIKALLEIPEAHDAPLLVGFGKPEIPYRRGTQRDVSPDRVHRPAIITK